MCAGARGMRPVWQLVKFLPFSSPVLQFLVVDADLDTNTRVDETDQSRWNSNEVTGSSVRGTSIARDIGDQAASDDQCRLSPHDAEGVHRIDDLKHGLTHSAKGFVNKLTSMVLCISPPLTIFHVMSIL